MKRLFIASFLVFLFGVPVHAMTVGNPPDTHGIFALEYDWLFKKGFTLKDAAVNDPSFPASADDIEFGADRAFLKGGIGFLKDRVNIYLKVGIGIDDATLKYTYTTPQGVGQEHEFKGKWGFAYGGGLKLRPLDLGFLYLTASGDYLQYKVNGTHSHFIDGTLATFYFDDTNKPVTSLSETVTLDEWQVAGTVNIRMWNITPYAGIKYSDAKLKEKYTFGISTIESESSTNIGFFGGIDFRLTEFGSLGIEARLSDETAVTVGLNVSYK